MRNLMQICGCVVLLWIASPSVLGQTWYDNFDDGSFEDGNPVTWNVNPLGAFPGQYTVADGDFVMFASDGDDDDESLTAWGRRGHF